MKFSLHYSILLVAATVACVAAAPTTANPEALVQGKVLSAAHRFELASNKLDKEKTEIAQQKTHVEKEMNDAHALALKLEGDAAESRELATGASKTAKKTRQTVVTILGDAANAYTKAKDSYEEAPGKPELDEEVLQNLKDAYENVVSAIGANSIETKVALNAALEADTKEKEADDAKTAAFGYASSIEKLTEVDNVISQKRQALVDGLSACVDDIECLITSIIGDIIEEPVDDIETADDEIAEDETEDDKVNEDIVEDDKVKTGLAEDQANTTDDKTGTTDNEDAELEVHEEKEVEINVNATETPDQETPKDKAAEQKKLEEIAAEKERREKRVKDAAKDAAKKKAEEVVEEEKASEKGNKNKKDKAAKKDKEAESVAEEGEATKKGEMKGEDKTVQEEKAGENDETKGVDKTVQEEKAGEIGEKKGEDKTKNAVVQDSGAKFNQPAVAVGILSVMFALAFGM